MVDSSGLRSVVLSGLVHAYERTLPVYDNATVQDPLDPATVYFNIGDGGNREGHNTDYLQLPDWSAFRDGTQFGHSRIELLNATHARFAWMRNADAEFKEGDSTTLVNRPALRKAAAAQAARRHLSL